MHDQSAGAQAPLPELAGGSTAEYAAAAVAAAEAIAAEAAAAVTAEAALTAAAAVATALTAAIKASATAELVASNAADAAVAAALLMPGSSATGVSDQQLAAAAKSRAGTVEIAAALAVATVAADVAQAAAAAATAAAEAVRVVEARLLADSRTGPALAPDADVPGAAENHDRRLQTPPVIGQQVDGNFDQGFWSVTPIRDNLGLAIGGELDLLTASALAAAFADRANDSTGDASYFLDLQALTFIDLRGLRAVADLHAAVVVSGQVLSVAAPSADSVKLTLALAARNGWWPATVRALTAGRLATMKASPASERRRPSRSAAVDRAAAAEDRWAAALELDAAERLGRAAAEALRGTQRDSLTGALLRTPGLRLLGRAVERARLGELLTIAFIDVDNLKARNDSQGHAAGDQLLRSVAAALRRGLRASDLVVRFGGDEFVCALPGTLLEEAEHRFNGAQRALAASYAGATISVGCAQFAMGDDLDGLLRRADEAMYAGRKRARG